MNGTRASIEALLQAVLNQLAEVQADVLVCAPFVYLGLVQQHVSGSNLAWGAQNVSEHQAGAYTGEVSAAMLSDFGCSHVIVGHSERRALYGETDAVVARKFSAAAAAGMTPVLCVGETLEERERGETAQVTGRQLQAVIDHAGVAALAHAVLAYEPVWAIGTGRTASADQAQQVHHELRARVAETDAGVAGALRILYGGSVKGSNAAELFAMADIDGGLIGGASLDAGEFVTICRAAG